MKRTVLVAAAAVILLSGSVHGQVPLSLDRPVWGPLLRITPFAGFAASSNRYEQWTVSGPGGTVNADYDVDLATGPVAGLALEVQAIERFAIVASAAVVSRGRTVEQPVGAGDGFVLEHEGSNFVFAKAGLALRLREQFSELQMHSLSATIFAAPAFVREMPKYDPSYPASVRAVLLEPLNHYGVSFGVDAEILLPWRALSFTAGVEDFVVWWNNAEFARRNDAVFASNGLESRSHLTSGPSHTFILRGGISFRIR